MKPKRPKDCNFEGCDIYRYNPDLCKTCIEYAKARRQKKLKN